MADSVMAESSLVAWLTVSVAESSVAESLTDAATDVDLVHELVVVFVALSAKSAVCSQASDVVASLLHADVQLQQLLLAVAVATS